MLFKPAEWYRKENNRAYSPTESRFYSVVFYTARPNRYRIDGFRLKLFSFSNGYVMLILTIRTENIQILWNESHGKRHKILSIPQSKQL